MFDPRGGPGLPFPSQGGNGFGPGYGDPIPRSKSSNAVREQYNGGNNQISRGPSGSGGQRSRKTSLPTPGFKNGGNEDFGPSSGNHRGDEYFNPETDASPPPSPTLGPTTNQIAAQMRCKVFFQQGFQQWKPLGAAKLKLYFQNPGNIKQLVVENEKTVLISTIVLVDGVERVGRVGVAVELSDKGERTGIIYMLQMKSETSAAGLYQQLLLGSDRAEAISS